MFQQIQLIGNLGKKPTNRKTQSGVSVTSFDLAVNRSWTGQDGKRQTKTIWFRVSVWNSAADAAFRYLDSGSQVFIVGEMEEARTWTDREGNNRASLEVRAQTVKFLDGQRSGQSVVDTEAETFEPNVEDTAAPF